MSSYESYRQQALTHDTEDANDSLSDKNSLLSGRVANPKQKHRIPHSARLGLRVLSLLLSLAAVGILAHATLIYRMTTDEIFTYPYGTKFKAWPQPLHLRPTFLMIGAAVTAALLNIVALLLSLGTVCTLLILILASEVLLMRYQQFDHIRNTKLGPYTAISGCFVALAASIAAAVYFQSWNTRDKGQHDLWSWTCTHRDVELQNKNLGFGTVCSEMVCVRSPYC